MTNDEIINDINDEDALRSLRDAADKKLQQIKDDKQTAKLELESKNYVNKYFVLYGKTWNGSVSTPNEDDITVVHVLSIDFVGNNFIRCDANVIKIEYDTEDEWLDSGINCKNFGQVNIIRYHSPSYDLYMKQDYKQISREDVGEIISDAFEAAKHNLTMWDN